VPVSRGCQCAAGLEGRQLQPTTVNPRTALSIHAKDMRPCSRQWPGGGAAGELEVDRLCGAVYWLFSDGWVRRAQRKLIYGAVLEWGAVSLRAGISVLQRKRASLGCSRGPTNRVMWWAPFATSTENCDSRKFHEYGSLF